MNALPQPRPAMHPAPPHRAHPERGVVLLVALVMLLLVTVLGLASVRMLTMEERMAANSFDRNLAFQAAETALREGEVRALEQSQLQPANEEFPNVAMDCNIPNAPINFNNDNCINGLCRVLEQVCPPPQPRPQPPPARWEDPQFNNWQPVSNPAAATSPLSPDPNLAPPQFFVEYLGSNFPCNPQNPTQDLDCQRYRITARSHNPAAAEGRAAVVLQSIYATE